jgi:hypothetical protein
MGNTSYLGVILLVIFIPESMLTYTSNSSSWKKRVEKGIPNRHRREHHWHDGRDSYKRRHWHLMRKSGVRFVAFPGVGRQSSRSRSAGLVDGDLADSEDDDEDGWILADIPRPSTSTRCSYYWGWCTSQGLGLLRSWKNPEIGPSLRPFSDVWLKSTA